MSLRNRAMTWLVHPERQKPAEFDGYTSRIFKEEVVGVCRVRTAGRMKFKEAVRMVLKNQPGSAYEPSGEPANFFDRVAGKMRSTGLDPARLQIFTAVGSPLDVQYGVAGFFVFEGIVVTVGCDLYDDGYGDLDDVCRMYCPRERRYGPKITVSSADALNGYADAATDVATSFWMAKKHGWKGVI